MSIQLSKIEEEIMHFFWKEEKFYDFSTLMNHFNEEEKKEWKKQTLNTFLSRLLAKGLLERQMTGRKAYYRYAMTETAYKQAKAREILDEEYEGKLSAFIVALTGKETLSDTDAEELLDYIQKR